MDFSIGTIADAETQDRIRNLVLEACAEYEAELAPAE
jgi:hypothetical protein